jgi:hypothetical protein
MFMDNSSGAKTQGNWMQKAVIPSHKGLFGAKAKKAGMSTREYAAKKASASGTLGREARLAQTFEKLRGK